MMNLENAGPSKAVVIQTAVQQTNEGGMPKMSCAVTKFTDILLLFARMNNQGTVSQLVVLLYDPTFDLDMFKKIIKNLKDCEEVSCKSRNRIEKVRAFKG